MKRLVITSVAILISLLVALSMFFTSASWRGDADRHPHGVAEPAPVRQGSAEPDEPEAAPATPVPKPDARPAGDSTVKPNAGIGTTGTDASADADADADADTSTPAPSDADAAKAPDDQPGSSDPTVESEPPSSPQPTSAKQAEAPPSFTAPLHVRKSQVKQTRVLGSDDSKSGYEMRVELTAWGAAIKHADLADYTTSVDSQDRYVILRQLPAGGPTASPFAARSITVAGQRIPLETVQWKPGKRRTVTLTPASAPKAPAPGKANAKSHRPTRAQAVTYTAIIVDAKDKPILRLTRTYRLAQGSYDLKLDQRIENLTTGPLSVQWRQNIQGDLPRDPGAYLGDRRTYATGYFNLNYDPNRYSITTKDAYYNRATIVKRGGIWPDAALEGKVELAWVASENRYFTVATHAALPPKTRSTADVPALTAAFPTVDADVFADTASNDKTDKALIFTLANATLQLAPGQGEDLNLSFYAGPRKQGIFAQPPFTYLHFEELIRYELGCTWCTFQWLAHALLWFLNLIYFIAGDWGIAIIVLVAVVRLLLHPITKRAQANMMKMGKQMQTLQPEMEKLKKKYKDDQTSLNREMMALYREKGVNPANVLGCLPMLLQTPIWIALYATLYFAIELRHEPAFYGFFQLFGNWSFLADLSSPDNFIKLYSHPVPVNLLFIHLNFQAINLFPILMAVVFFLQQKFTTPPPTNDQAASQQKIMKFMVLLFPLFLYGAPSGLTLYILTSTTAGVIDSYLVRKHVQEEEEKGTLFKKKERKPGGMMDRMQQKLQAKQQELEKRQNQQTKKVKSKKSPRSR